ncbi:MAG: hypothetical protein AseanaTS_29110 [Candidatus Pelagadaptatus aseana]|uniref:putative bifunctional diguanylate cyclase/phosphodiesterase n=1 Tax=Candidatus Pelagadaptatus aseana TaxID=3120508 RepID=UPI0039B19B8E
MTYRHRIAALYFVVIVAAVTVSSFIFSNNRDSQNNHKALFSQTLPLLQTVRELQEAKTEYERLLYEYYATTDRPRLLTQLQQAETIIYDNTMEIARQTRMDESIREMTRLFDNMKAQATALDTNLDSNSIDWDLARAQLVRLTEAGNQVNSKLKQLQDAIAAEAEKGSMVSLENNELGSQLVILFSISITALALFVGFFVDRYLREAAERKRIAMFAERNPNPVLSADFEGNITYANPSGQQLLQQMQLSQWQQFLPADLTCSSNHREKATGEFHQQGRTFQYASSSLDDLEACHIYLEDITDKVAAQQQLQFQASHDPLTELPNRLTLEQSLEQHLAQSGHNNFCLVLINLHRFDRITSIHGYQFGDTLIKGFCQNLIQTLRSQQQTLLGQQPFRIDGTTFGLVITGSDSEQQRQIMQTILNLAEHPIRQRDSDFYLPIRLGSSRYPDDGDKLHDLIKCADAALLQAKQSDSEYIQHYNVEIHKTEQRLNAIEKHLRQDSDQLTLHYQPKMCAKTRTILGAEALMRWPGEQGFRYYPDEFIPVAEQSGLIIGIGEQAIQTGIEQILQWQPQGDFKLAINLSGRQFQHPDFMKRLQRMVKPHSGIEQFLEFEITESMLMQDIHHSIDIMHQLKAMGFQLSIDDFGTGYSSLSYLKQFPIDKLKIDRSFVMNLETQPEDKTMVASILYLAHSLGLKVVAEGVETEYQLKYLSGLDCEEIQGYYFSKPLAAEEFTARYFA